MTHYFSDFDRLFDDFPRDGLILTPNKRLSRFIQAQFALYQSRKGIKAWTTLQALAINAWFMQQWEELVYAQQMAAPMVMDASQENALWLSIIRQSEQEVVLFNPSATANACRRAWNTLVQWQLDPHQQADIAELFLRWVEDYEKRCDKQALIDSSQVRNRVLDAIAANSLKLPVHIILYAFDDINPQVQKLVDLAGAANCRIEMFDPKMSEPARWRRFMAEDPEDEILSAARWAAQKVAADPDTRVGVVIPKLLPMRAKVESIFTKVLEPQYTLPENPRHASAFNISAGIPLSDVPPIASALLALKLNSRALSIEEVSKLLHSPFIGVQREMSARSFFDVALREAFVELSPSKLRALAGEFGCGQDAKKAQDEEEKLSQVNEFYQSLHGFHQLQLHAPNRQAPSAWGKLFAAQLASLKWPGERVLDTLEYQQVDAWRESLAALSRYDYVFASVSFNDAYEMLTRICFEKQFQAQTMTSPVQVLGLFEAAGLVFDHLWVMHLDDESWPAPTSPNPLLPKSLQKQQQMPLSSVEKELALAQKLTARFKQSASSVVLSYAAREGDKEFQHSALIDDIPPIKKSKLALLPFANPIDTVRDSAQLETFIDIAASALNSVEHIRGGTQIIKDQAACPFRAFATHRLGARFQEQALPGLGPAERGMLIHDTLEFVWKKLGDQAALLNADEDQLNELIFRGAERSFQSKANLLSIGPRLKKIEHARIKRLIRAWLELEKMRAPFSVFFSEVNRHITLAALPIHIRYDRIDKLDDDSLFVIDYKTGRSAIKSWAGERPDEPQVPIYGIANSEKVSGLAFGQINIEDVGFKGISQSEDTAPGLDLPESLEKFDLPGNWQGILAHWQQVLEDLAKEFIAGEAAVRPKHGALTCRYCALHSLCRIKETLGDASAKADAIDETSGVNDELSLRNTSAIERWEE